LFKPNTDKETKGKREKEKQMKIIRNPHKKEEVRTPFSERQT